MRNFKVFFLLVFCLMFTLSIGCSKVDGKDTQSIKAPNNDNLIIKGTWKIENIYIIDDEIENKNEILSQKDTLVSISNNEISIFNKAYRNPNFKLKVVDKDYVLSYELDFYLKDIVKSDEKLDVVSLIDSNKLLGEFVLIDNDKGYLFYSGILLELIKEDINPSNIRNSSNEIEAEVLDEDYNSDVGVMMALKTPRKKLADGTFSQVTYRTLWISFKNNKLEDILQKDNIVFPRLNGIWTIENSYSNEENIYSEQFIIKPIDGRESNQVILKSTENLYKEINFISNDYIAIEKYEGNYFDNKYPIYNTIPVDNINSSQGLSIEEIYSDEAKSIYKREFDETLKNLLAIEKEKLITKVDYTNFTIKRLGGQWNLFGKISSRNSLGEGVDFKLSINPSNKILNYDTLLIPWKYLKVRFPFIEDAYTSPTGRIAIIIFDDKLFIYELEDGNIAENPLGSINLNKGESVIMSEWATESYVEGWTKAFKDGKLIKIEEE